MPGTARPAPITPATPFGSGYGPCTLTWYDPALGGINSSGGVANPHAATASGEPYDPNAYTCAAPPNFPFGTRIHITTTTNKFGIIVKVNDRGGAIQMNGNTPHFDLSKAANNALKGATTGLYKIVPGSDPLGQNTRGFGSQAAHDISSTVTGALSSIGNILGFIFSRQFLYIAAGLPIVLIALFMIYKSQGGSVPSVPKAMPV